MNKHVKYMKYILIHKYFVFIGCMRLKVSLWQALKHDWTKFLPVEYFPYLEQFYGNHATDSRDIKGYFDAARQSDAFAAAWLHHIHMNPHHWQYYILRQDDGQIRVLDMPDEYVREMVADWYGAGKAQVMVGAPNATANTKAWWVNNKNRIIVHDNVVAKMEEYLEQVVRG